MDFILATVDQLTAHLRALRKARGLTQAALGDLIGVSQNRIADIERDPGAVSMAQMHRVLSALGGKLILQDSGSGWAGAKAVAKTLMSATASLQPGKTSIQKTPGATKGLIRDRTLVSASNQILGRVAKPGDPLPPTPKSRTKGTW